jgi:hypothetical protein
VGHFWVDQTFDSVPIQGHGPAVRADAAGHYQKRDAEMNVVKFQVVRVLLALTALAASGLILEAGRRW